MASDISDVARLARDDLSRVRASLRDRVSTCDSLEGCAQAFVELLGQHLPSVLLLRLYVTVPAHDLPLEEEEAAARIADLHGVRPRITSTTQVLCLLASRGARAEWNDRRASKLHRAIPLVDDLFVSSAPMLDSLFSQLGIESASAPVPAERVGIDGIFLVDDAATTRDARGRFIVPAQAFVEEHGVKSVFGFGGRYVTGCIVAVIAFARIAVQALDVRAMASLGATFRMCTSRHLLAKRIFEDGP